MAESRACRCCGKSYEHPQPASLSTRRNCHDCAQLPDAVRDVLESHLTEIGRLKRRLEKLEKPASASQTASA